MGMTTGKIDPRYGDASATPPPWTAVERLLTEAQLYWIITVRSDGRPHAVPLVGVWQDGAFAFCTGAEEQKQRNLDANAHVAVTTGSTGANGWNSGKDVVVEGTAVRVTDPEALQRLAAAWFAKYGEDWKYEVHGQKFVEVSHSGGGAQGAWVYEVAPAKVIVFGDAHGQTTYRF
jgi:nitroimidazol reductase NimA-like FMN-containing flavoprotein (pyridoxamine 5'-phosphate oxidase superfamily)